MMFVLFALERCFTSGFRVMRVDKDATCRRDVRTNIAPPLSQGG